MCGFAGWIAWNQDVRQHGAVVAAMGQRMACRGPDAKGLWVSRHAGLAHHRLIVIDPEGGAQPMTVSHQGRTCTIVYNGELYNTEQVRADLMARGHRFQSRSDTEVVLRAYMEWGTASPARLNGIFAYGIWDDAAHELFLARDRLGVKPLFYALREDNLVFASELKGIVAHPAFPPELDAEGLAEVFALGPSRTPGHGVFRGVRELRAGHWLRWSPAGADEGIYWRLSSRPHPDDLATTAATVRDLLQDIVERQLVSDVPVATLLSGGLDSSAVSALAQAAYRAQGRGPLTSFSVTFADLERDFRQNPFQTSIDAPYARLVAEFLGTRHREVVLDTPELVEYLAPTLYARDVPGMADVDTSLLLFCRAIKEEATVALSGEAADEVFGGYPWFFRSEALNAVTFPWNLQVARRAGILRPEIREWIQPEAYVARRYQEALAEVPRLSGEDPHEARMRELFYLNLTRFLPTLLDRKDRMSMAVGLEVRVPFCDHRLVEYVWNIPWAMKTVGGTAKGILRYALDGLLPKTVLERRKSPYPSTHNPAYGAAVSRLFWEEMADPRAPLRRFLDLEALKQWIREGTQAGGLPWFSQLMGIPQLYAYLWQLNRWFYDYRIRVP